jgi:hypothetical protein
VLSLLEVLSDTLDQKHPEFYVQILKIRAVAMSISETHMLHFSNFL